MSQGLDGPGASAGPTGLSSLIEPAVGLDPAGFDPSRVKIYWENRCVYVLPRLEARPSWVKQFGPIAVGLGFHWSSFGVGADVLRAGALVQIGPVYLWAAHIEKQLTAFTACDSGSRAERRDRNGLDPEDGRAAAPQAPHRPSPCNVEELRRDVGEGNADANP